MMKHLDKVGFVMALLGLGGLAEAYGNGRQISIALILIIVGALLVWIGDMANDIEISKRTDNSNCLDRLYFLKK